MDRITLPIDAYDFAALAKSFAANHKDGAAYDADVSAFASCDIENESVAEFLLENTLLLHKDTCGYAKEVRAFSAKRGELEAVADECFVEAYPKGHKAAKALMEIGSGYAADVADGLLDADMVEIKPPHCAKVMEKATPNEWQDFIEALSPVAHGRLVAQMRWSFANIGK